MFPKFNTSVLSRSVPDHASEVAITCSELFLYVLLSSSLDLRLLNALQH